MFPYARQMLARRPLLVSCLVCSALIALGPLALATVLAPAVAGLLLTGELSVAGHLLPEPLAAGSGPLWIGAAAGLFSALGLWCRIYSVAVWDSDDRHSSGFRSSWIATRAHWRRVFLLYLQAYAALAIVIALFGGILLFTGRGPAGGIVTALLAGAGIILAIRTVLRIGLSLAIRSALFDGTSSAASWRAGRHLMRERRRDVAAAWIFLLAIGASLWFGGRLLSPILQDTAMSFPNGSAYAWGREVTQYLVAMVVEGCLMALSVALWTGVFLDRDLEGRASVPRERGTDPATIRLLVTALSVAVVANGVPALIDVASADEQRDRLLALGRDEIDPSDVVRPQSAGSSAPRSISYEVNAHLEEDQLSWTTLINYRNDTGESLNTIGLHLYPAAYTRPVAKMPLAADMLSSGLGPRLHAEAEPGTFLVKELSVAGDEANFSRVETAVEVHLDNRLRPGDSVAIEVSLEARLPHFPERFGVWRDLTLLGNWIPTVAERAPGMWRLDRYSDVGDPFFSQVADYVVSITADERQSIVGSGELRSVRSTDAGREWVFEAPGTRDFAAAAGRFLAGREMSVGGIEVRSWYPKDRAEQAANNLRDAASAVEYYVGRYGAPGETEIEVLLTEGLLGGMEYPGLVFTSNVLTQLEGLPVLPKLARHVGFGEIQSRYVVGHEVAHQWWYGLVGNDQIREPWMDEALAETSTRLWLRDLEGNDRTWQITNLATSARARRGVIGAGVVDFTTNSAYTAAIYASGSQILLNLERMVGRARFESILATWAEEQGTRIGTIDEFLKVVEREAGSEAADFLSEYR